jgi:hypothetical protein
MSLESYDVVFNTSVRFKDPLEIDEKEVLGLFGEVMQAIPELNDYRREGDDFDLIERITGKPARHLRVRKKGITLAVAPPYRLEDLHRTAKCVYPLIARHLKPTPFMIEFLDIAFQFEFSFKGNHDVLVLTRLFAGTPYAQIATEIEGAVLDFQPALSVSLSKDHSVIALIEIHTSTSLREIESRTFDGDEIKLVCGVAKVRGLASQSLESTYDSVYSHAVPFVQNKLVTSVVEPLRAAATP